ncbi:carbohydrate ABC transporter permease [Paenibacillus sp. MWE-103]|uniref:Carbohydrate ABC transporter permease n=1 Tax=Paenibacillus artemisiicola TaxID=1172618 RepID=A0ABS3W323_9BACL|nr:carbohydrate ABC transporter permease [Paenibacillus artemisiicola]MBO7742708.1 carbohydrate ABC transporter permease [Paenibacillus artemisiicola]
MVQRNSPGRTAFVYANYALLVLLGLLCIFPLIQVLAISFSSSSAAASGLVKFFPVDFTFDAYKYVATKPEFIRSFGITLERVVLGVAINMVVTVLLAYPLSKDASQLRFRTGFVWLFVFTMLFNGGLIPTYVVIKNLHMLNSIWALVLPGAVPIFNVILLLNFFRNIPKELLEASYIDGASQWSTLWRIVVPVSLPALATITLFATVGHWNAWFDGIIYMNQPEKYPLQSYMQTIIVARDMSNLSLDDIEKLKNVSDRNIKAAQIFLGSLPILLIYPLLQRFFMTGIVLGSVKE